MQIIRDRILDKLLSGRFIATLLLTFTYCLLILMVTNTANKMMLQEKDIGKDIVVFIIGNFTGTAMGAVIAYFFKSDRYTKPDKENR